jgi:hypothetical protein
MVVSAEKTLNKRIFICFNGGAAQEKPYMISLIPLGQHSCVIYIEVITTVMA